MVLKKFIYFALARAKEKAPCIIFIDEIDSVGSKRIADAMHPHANQTVNQVCDTVLLFPKSYPYMVFLL